MSAVTKPELGRAIADFLARLTARSAGAQSRKTNKQFEDAP
jgi:hypothetical protein